MEYAQSWAEAVNALIKKYGGSQYSLAQYTRASRESINRWANGNRVPSRKAVEMLIEDLELPIWDANDLREAAGFATKSVFRMPTGGA